MVITISKEKLTNTVISDKPHVVILGAGASRAACPNGDMNGKNLPLMSDFADCLNLRPKLKEWGIDPNQKFEDIFSNLFEQEENEKMKNLEKNICDYFNSLTLPLEPTIYDHLVLSLRETDFIASFNWDPLLLQAYQRNCPSGIKLPRLVFLHGNVMVGSCKEHNRVNYVDQLCEYCKKPLQPVELLYPITKKDYAQNKMIKTQWQRLETHLKKAFHFTIFGYSAPKTDVEAVSILKKAWNQKRSGGLLEDITIITPNTEEAHKRWKSFPYSQHMHPIDNFYESSTAKYPRRGFESSYEGNVMGHFVESNTIPKDLNFPKLWKWYEQFNESEERYRNEHPFPVLSQIQCF